MTGINNLDGNSRRFSGACSLTTGVPKFSGGAHFVATHVVGHARDRTLWKRLRCRPSRGVIIRYMAIEEKGAQGVSWEDISQFVNLPQLQHASPG